MPAKDKTLAAFGRDTSPAFIDLFCGCGGFTLGMERARFRCLAAIDLNAESVATLRSNANGFPTLTPERVFQEDLTRFGPEQLAEPTNPLGQSAAACQLVQRSIRVEPRCLTSSARLTSELKLAARSQL